MRGYCYGESRPMHACPWCEEDCSNTVEYVDIGVGLQQATGATCADCRSHEISPYDETEYSSEEESVGWTKPEKD